MTNAVYLASLVNSSGNNVTLQGGVVGSGTGIAFPATQVASSDANTLDDYEEGTWTPSVNGGTSTISSVAGKYTKIGNIVVCSFNFTVSSNGTLDSLAGLPFTVNGYVNNGVAREFASTGYIWNAQVTGSTTTFYFRRYDNNNSTASGFLFAGTVIYNV